MHAPSTVEQQPTSAIGKDSDGRWRVPGAWLAAIALYTLWVATASERSGDWATYISFAIVVVVAGFACAQAARVTADRTRTGWRLFATACVLSLLGQLTTVIGMSVEAMSFLVPYAPDILFIAFGAVVALAIAHFRIEDATYASLLRRLANVALITCTFAAAGAAALLEPALARGTPYWLTVTLLQLLIFGVCFVIALYMVWSYRWRSLSGPLLLVICAVAVQAACGLIYIHEMYVEQVKPPRYVSALWLASFGLLHWGAREQALEPQGPDAAITQPMVNERMVEAILPGALLLLMIIALVIFRQHATERSLLVVGGMLGAFALVLAAREVLMQFEERRLAAALEKGRVELEHAQRSLATKTTALHETEEWLKVAAAAGNVGLWAWDFIAKTSYGSTTWKRQLGYQDDEVGNSFEAWRSLIHPDDVSRVIKSANEFVAHPTAGYQLELRMRHRDGSYRWILTQVALLTDATGRATSMVGSNVDITRQKETEQNLKESQARYRERAGELEQRVTDRTLQLQDAYHELESFAYAVAHDLKAPLRAMDGFSSLLLESTRGRLSPQERNYLQRICGGAERMNALIEGLLDYARIERRALHHEMMPLRETIESVVAPFGELDRPNVELRLDVPEVRISTDREAFCVVVRNLLDNAIKFTRQAERPTIEIGAQQNEDGLRLWVRDNGIGFDPQYHDQIFAMFQRLHRDDQYPGTGMGLALAAKAAQRMKGKLWAESAPGHGAVFFFDLPAQSS